MGRLERLGAGDGAAANVSLVADLCQLGGVSVDEGAEGSLEGDLCQLSGNVSKVVETAVASLVGDLCQLGGGVSTVFDRRYRAGGDDFLSPKPKTFSVPAREVDECVTGEGGTATWLVVRGLYPELDDDANVEVNELGMCIC